MNSNKRGPANVRLWWLAIAGGAMMLALTIGISLSSHMLTPRNLRNVLTSCGNTMVITAAFAIPFSRGHIDLSVLGFASFCGMIFALLSNAGLPAIVAALIVIVIGIAIGAINGLIALIFRRKNPLFTAALTICIGLFYRYLSYIISSGSPIPLSSHTINTLPLQFMLPLVIIIGVFALLSFTYGGKNAFSAIYKKDEDRCHNPILSFIFSGFFSALAAVLMVSRTRAAIPTIFSINPSLVLPLAIAGIMIPNVKKSKAHAFIGYLTIIPAVLASALLLNTFVLTGLNTYTEHMVLAVFALFFAVACGIFGGWASKINLEPARQAAPADPVPADPVQVNIPRQTGTINLRKDNDPWQN